MLHTTILFIKTHYAICGIFVTAYLFNLLAGHKSQVDAWCNQHPKVASLMKVIRGVLPFDPWLIIQAVYLLLTKKLPPKLQVILTTVEATTTSPEPVAEKKSTKDDSIPPTAA